VKIRMMGLTLALLLMGACSTASPVKQFVRGDELAFYDFTSPATFEEGLYGNGNARLQISNGVYNVQVSAGDNTLYYGQWGNSLSDVIIDVDATQTSSDLNTTYGVMCRARGTVGQTVQAEATAEATDVAGSDTIIASANTEATVEATSEETAEATLEVTQEGTAEATAQAGVSNAQSDNTQNNGDGYLFVVAGNGRYAIIRSQGRSTTRLVDWTSSGVINMGAAQNRIRAVCMGTYLALYVNGQFVADTSDDLYTKGQVGLAAATAGRAGLILTFDNLSVYQAKPG
jgi:hypothetical protein